MIAVTAFVLRARHAALLILAAAALSLLPRANAAGETAAVGTNTTPVIAVADIPLLKLPVVARPQRNNPPSVCRRTRISTKPRRARPRGSTW